MKKLILIVFGVMSILGVEAQTLPFDVNVPNVKYIRSKNGVNVRQQPSVNSKKLIADDIYDPEGGYGDALWSLNVPRDYKPVQFLNGISTREKDGWYYIENVGPVYGEGGWVSATYSEPFIPFPIEYPKTSYRSNTMYAPGIKWIKGQGNYKDGEYVLISEGHFGDNAELSIFLGKLVDGIIICPYEFPIDIDWECDFWSDGDDNFYLKYKSEKNWKDSNWYVIPPMLDSYDWADYYISDSFVNDLLTKVEPQKLTEPRIYYLYDDCLYNSTLPGISY